MRRPCLCCERRGLRDVQRAPDLGMKARLLQLGCLKKSMCVKLLKIVFADAFFPWVDFKKEWNLDLSLAVSANQ